MAYEHIKNLMKERGETQSELARVINRTQAVITNLYEGRRSLQVEEVDLLAEHFGVSRNYIMYGVDTAPNVLTDAEIALTDALKDVFQVLLHHGLSTADSLSRALNYQRESYQEKKLDGAVSVMDSLLSYVNREPKESERDIIQRLLKLPTK